MKEEQNYKLFEPDWDNINDILILKELFKSLKITMTFDVNNKEQSEEIEYLKSIKAIKEINVELIKTNNN